MRRLTAADPAHRHMEPAGAQGRRAEVLTWTALAEARLEPATVYTTWCEDRSYGSCTRVRPLALRMTVSELWHPQRQITETGLRGIFRSHQERGGPAEGRQHAWKPAPAVQLLPCRPFARRALGLFHRSTASQKRICVLALMNCERPRVHQGF